MRHGEHSISNARHHTISNARVDIEYLSHAMQFDIEGACSSRCKALNSSVLLHSSLYMLYTFECRWVLGHRTVCLPCTVRPSNDCNLCNVYRFAPRQCMPVRYAAVRDSFVCMFGTHARHMSCFPDKLHPRRSLDPLLGRGSCSMLLWV